MALKPEPVKERHFGTEARAKETHSSPDQLNTKTNQFLSRKTNQFLSMNLFKLRD